MNLDRRYAFSASLFLSLTAACGATKDTPRTNEPPPEEKPPVERSFCEATQRGCELQVECNAVVFNHARTVAECVAQTGCASFTPAQLTELGVALDPVAIDACIGALDTLSCDGVAALRLGFGSSMAACQRLTRGSTPEGGACHGAAFDDCAPGFECRIEDSCPGTCTAIAESCTQGSCGPDSYCSYETERCERLGTNGDRCEGNLPQDYGRMTCAAGNYCALKETGDWLCEPTIEAGKSCTECLDPECCEPGFYCTLDEPNHVCAPRQSENVTCYFTAMCNEGLYCDFTSNECRTPGELGDACTDASGSCAFGLYCELEASTPVCVRDPQKLPEVVDRLDAGDLCVRGDVCPLGMACVGQDGKPVIGPDAAGNCGSSLGLPGDSCESSFDAFACAEGICNFATDTCPTRLAVGDACEYEGLDTSCPFALCLSGACAGASDLVCEKLIGEVGR